MKMFHLFIALAFLVVLPTMAQAAVNTVTPNPSRADIAPKGPTSLNVIWSVNETSPTNGLVTISSPAALLQVNGTTVATLAGSLSQSVTRVIGQVSTLSFVETLSISPAIAQQISRAGAGSVTIIRSFNDGAGASIGTVQVSTGHSGPLAVRRIELKFENDARTDIVQQGDTMRAVADISFRSNGLLRGEWRIVDASASLGVARGRVLQVVRQQLVSSGEGRTRIVSPPLPTKTNGLHLVSFSVEDTDGNIAVPILRYFVLEGRDNMPPTNLSVLTPGDNANVDQETVFSWNTLTGAQAYQLEILELGSENPVAGKIVPGTDLKLSLSALTFEDLVSGKTYDWRVRAFAGGKIIGQSERMSLHIP